MSGLHGRSTAITRNAIENKRTHQVIKDPLSVIEVETGFPALPAQASIGWGTLNEDAIKVYEDLATHHNFIMRPETARNPLDSIFFQAAQSRELPRPTVVFEDSSREAPDFRYREPNIEYMKRAIL